MTSISSSIPEKSGMKSQYRDLNESGEADAIVPADPGDFCGFSNDELPDVSGNEMDCSDVIEGSWFPANTSKRRRNRSRASSSGSETGNSPVVRPKKKKDGPTYPTNKSMKSSGSGTVVLIAQEAQGLNSLVGATTKKFTLDPIGVSRGLKDTVDESQVKDIRVNKRRNIVTVEFKEKSCPGIDSLLAVTSIGSYGVHCYRPAMDFGQVAWGVVGPIHEDVDLDEMLSSIVCEGFEALHVSRLPRFVSGKRETSRAVKIGFAGKSLPKQLKIAYMAYEVRPYVQPPLRCYRCQRHGHMASGCTAAVRCLVCGGPHHKDSCRADAPYCPNCHGSHVASSRDCPLNRDASRIGGLVRSGLSFADARKQVVSDRQGSSLPPTASQLPDLASVRGTQSSSVSGSASPGVSTGLQMVEVEADFHQTQGSYYIPRRYPRRPLNYATAVSPSPVSEPAVGVPPLDDSLLTGPASASCGDESLLEHRILSQCQDMISSAVATSIEAKILEKCQEAIAASVSTLFSKFSTLLLELFTTNLFNEGKREREMLLLSLIRNHFGSNISDPLLVRCQSQSSAPSTSAAKTAEKSTKSASVSSRTSSAAPVPAASKSAPKSTPTSNLKKTPQPSTAKLKPSTAKQSSSHKH